MNADQIIFYVTTSRPAHMSGSDFGAEVDAYVLTSDARIEHNGELAYRTVILVDDRQSADEIERLLDEDDNVIEVKYLKSSITKQKSSIKSST